MATEAGEAVERAGEEAVHTAFPPFDPHYFPSQVLWLAITFIAFYLLMKYVAIPQIGGILADRKARIAADLAEAERAKAASDDAAAAYEQALTEARNRAFKIAEEANEAAAASAAKNRQATEAELAGKLAESERSIAGIRSRALAEVGTIAADAAEAVVARLIGGAVGKAEIGDAVSAALAARGGADVR